MKTYTVKIRFVKHYLQDRFTDKAKEELENFVSKGIAKTLDDDWVPSMYFDDNGIYIPGVQVKHCLTKSGKDMKMKKTRRSMEGWVISCLSVDTDKIYIGKKEPDEILKSYPQRRDGNRVTKLHPMFYSGLEVEFELTSFDETMEDKAIENLIKNAGLMYGLGARRRDMYGRFELIKFSSKKVH